MNEARADVPGIEIVVPTVSHNWWTFTLRGVIALCIALVFFLLPAQSLLALTLVFGAFALADGVLGLVAAVRRMRRGERWGALLAGSLLGILVGLVVVIVPFVATLALATWLWVSFAVWAVLTGVLEIAAAIRLRREIEGEVWLALSGLVSMAVGVLVVWLLITSPAETLIALGWLLAAYAAVFGIILLLLGRRLHRLQRLLRAAANGAGRAPAGPEDMP